MATYMITVMSRTIMKGSVILLCGRYRRTVFIDPARLCNIPEHMFWSALYKRKPGLAGRGRLGLTHSWSVVCRKINIDIAILLGLSGPCPSHPTGIGIMSKLNSHCLLAAIATPWLTKVMAPHFQIPNSHLYPLTCMHTASNTSADKRGYNLRPLIFYVISGPHTCILLAMCLLTGSGSGLPRKLV